MTEQTPEPPLPPFPTLASLIEVDRVGAKMRFRIDGVTFPWMTSLEPRITLDRGVQTLHLSIPAHRVTVDVGDYPVLPVSERRAVGAQAVAEAITEDTRKWAETREWFAERDGTDPADLRVALRRPAVMCYLTQGEADAAASARAGVDDDQAGHGVVEDGFGNVAVRCSDTCSLEHVGPGSFVCDRARSMCQAAQGSAEG